MSHENDLNPADRELEAALRSLSPASARVDPIAAAFRAGENSARRATRAWQSLAAVVTVALIGSWMIPSPRNSKLPALVDSTTPIAVETVNPQSVLVMQQAVGAGGIDALPRTLVPPSRALEAKDIF